MSNDSRIRANKLLFKQGEIKKLSELFDLNPVTPVVRHLKMNYDKFKRQIDTPWDFTLDQLCRMAQYFEVDEKQFVLMILSQRKPQRKK